MSFIPISKLVVASNNSGKISEIQALLPGIEIIPQGQLAIPEAEENAVTFIENALLKARNAAKLSGLPALADDSGLVIDALQGAPGVYSARYAGKGATDQQNLDKVLAEMHAVPIEQRQARFVCVLALVRHAEDPLPLIAHGLWEGMIMTEPRGSNGFGYDPIFWVAEYDCASAELLPQQKNSLSHRGQALKQMLAQLSKQTELEYR